jgi:outer membrane lipoprotein SlyB
MIKDTAPAASGARFAVGARRADRQRIKVCFHMFTAVMAGGRWVDGSAFSAHVWRHCRTFARPSSPEACRPNIEFIDPPSADMLVISNDHGNAASGVDAGGAVSTLSFRLGRPPGGGVLGAIGAAFAPTVQINLAAGLTPLQVAAAIVAALPAGFAAQASLNAPAFNAVNGSVDIKIRRDDGTRVVIRSEQTTDTALTLDVARLNMASINGTHPGTSLMPASIDFRAVIRAAPGADDRMDCYVIGQFTGPGLRGRAFVPATDLPAAFQPPAPLRWATVMAASWNSGAVMDGSDNLPFTYPHESGHVMLDAFHTDNADAGGPTELMAGTGTSVANAVNATKRLCDGPVTVRYAFFTPQLAPPAAAPPVGGASVAAINATQRLHTRGAAVVEAW